MYIAPQSNIRILKDVPLDTTYNHTLYWENESAQSAYFISKQKYNLTEQTYQRINKGTMRVGIIADNLYDCNYLMFQNTGFGNKWFYCFIKSVEYVNNEVSEITYELDSMQTWYFDFTVEDSFVEREHSLTDNIGDNILPEPLELGEYTFNGFGSMSGAVDLSTMAVLIVSKDQNPEAQNRGTYINRVYSGCVVEAFLATDLNSINAAVANFNDAPENLVSVYMCPLIAVAESFLIPPVGGVTLNQTDPNVVNYNYNVSGDALTGNEYLDGYKPKNKKLYTYPYNFIEIVNGTGDKLTLRYEFFYNGLPNWNISVQIAQPVRCTLRPVNYKDSQNSARGTLNSEVLNLDGFPTCAVVSDYYMAWLAQQGSTLPMKSGAGVMSAFLGGTVLTGGNLLAGAATAAISAIGSTISAMSEHYAASVHADILQGSQTSNGYTSDNLQNYYGGRCSITRQYAQIIDDFFTMYGYTCKRVKRPTYNYRPHWNYVKTIGCNIIGSIPCDELKRIAQIFDNGITFWKNPSEVGNYLLDNSPQSGD